MTQTQEEFYQEHAVDGVLTDAQMGTMLGLPVQAESGEPAPHTSVADAGAQGTAAAPAAQAAPKGGSEGGADGKAGDAAGAVDESQLNAQNAVILAKDGKHTISFDRLEEARERARVAEETLAAERAEKERLRGELAAAQKAKPAQGAAAEGGEQGGEGAPAGGTGKPAILEGVDFGDYSDEKIAQAVVTLVDKRVAGIEAKMAGSQAEAAETKAVEDHYTPIYTAHPDADSIAESTQFKAWKDAQPSLMRRGIEAALAEGNSQDVIDVFSTYKQATGKTGGADAGDGKVKANPDADAATLAAADKAIADAKVKVPNSLTDIPAGTNAHHDEADALLARSSTQLMNQFEGKSPDEIMKLMDRTL